MRHPYLSVNPNPWGNVNYTLMTPDARLDYAVALYESIPKWEQKRAEAYQDRDLDAYVEADFYATHCARRAELVVGNLP